MSTPTPRTDAAWASSFEPCEYRAAHTARTMRDECERLETELARLRPELENVYALVTPVGFDLPGGIFETARAVTKLRAERDQLRAEVERLKTCGIVELAAINSSVLEYCKHWEARVERAEADAAAYLKRAESFSKIGDEAETDLDAERARLDWLQEHALAQHSEGISISKLGRHYNGFPGSLRAAIDAAMKEGA